MTTAAEERKVGRAQFDMKSDEQTLTVQLDRQGFRRLLQTLEKLAESGQPQDFGRSGRKRRRKARSGDAAKEVSIDKLRFFLDENGSN